MFSYFWKKPAPELPLTRFESCVELKQVGEALTVLRNKEAELAAAATKGAGTVDYDKSTVVSTIVAEIDSVIAQFNAQPAHENHDDEVRAVLQLVRDIWHLVDDAMRRDKDILERFRTATRQNIAASVDWGVFLAELSILYLAPISFFMKFCVYAFGMKSANQKIMEKSGLNDVQTRTMIILHALKSKLFEVDFSLRRVLREDHVEDGEHDNLPLPGPDYQGRLLHVLMPAVEQLRAALNGRVKNSQLIESLNLSESETKYFEKFIDPVSLCVPDIPVKLEEQLYDLETLIDPRLKVDADGMIENPLNRNKFFLRDIQPCREAYGEIQDTIARVKRERAERQLAQQQAQELAQRQAHEQAQRQAQQQAQQHMNQQAQNLIQELAQRHAQQHEAHDDSAPNDDPDADQIVAMMRRH